MSEEWFVLVNPEAGHGRARGMWPKLSRLLTKSGVKHRFVYSEHRQDNAEHLGRAVAQGYRRIIIAGGDGTIHVALNGLFHEYGNILSEFTIGVIPVGTGNDWLRSLEIPNSCKEAIKCIAAGRTRKQDIATVRYSTPSGVRVCTMANVAGVGLDARVIEAVDDAAASGNKGRCTYVMSLVRKVLSHKSQRCNVVLDDGQPMQVDLFSASVGNGRFNGGGIEQLPLSKSDDGLLDLTIIRNLSLWRIILQIHRLFDGHIYDIAEVEHFTCRKVSFSGFDSPVEVDGELGGNTPMTVEIIPGALRVIVK